MVLHNLLSKEGVSALAYTADDASVPWLCLLRIVKSHTDTQLGLYLEYPLPRPGIDDKQRVFLRYEGDNLVPGTISLTKLDISLPATLLTDLGRNGSHQTRTLSLTLKQPCSVWHRKEAPSVCPDFPKLLKLARARQIRIVFDTNWLGTNYSRFQCIFNGSKEFARVPILPNFTNLYRQVEWSILSLLQDVSPGADTPIDGARAGEHIAQDMTTQDPPPYQQEPGSVKRSRDNGLSPVPDTPATKRSRHPPDSPLLDCSTPTSQVSSTSTVPVNLFQEAVASEVKKALPGLLADFFGGMRTGHSSSSRSSPTPPYTRISNAPTRYDRTPNRRLTPITEMERTITSALTQTFAQDIDRAFEHASEHASELYNSASIEIEEIVANARSDLAMISEDQKFGFNEYCSQQVDDFEQRVAEGKEEAEAEIRDVFLTASENFDTAKQAARANYRQNALNNGRRAISLPLVKEDEDGITNL
ncbi:hypothetical protein GGP41_010728 [Bipolaris sorokiniana]|uniref:Uncharacterized protein n=2 Tax=Cochliobolus sativus TaxID=45130 RepID=A0A8H5ZI96_COCSA|nr:uncharacterized protein COCSADRAFT_355382 [Bipolaris sorokiniana ND90Pr]EMD65957.1 hypothetical protein COCSADRAFT_355382 [Bipolaris sorokiniana ND90Pr]KAF5851018.1 hypothetical protein GGP41_010728 [Bipolaris sorokiniana]